MTRRMRVALMAIATRAVFVSCPLSFSIVDWRVSRSEKYRKMMRQMEHSNKTKIIIGLIVFFVLFSFAPTLYEWNARGRVHEDRYFELVHNFPTDYNLY